MLYVSIAFAIFLVIGSVSIIIFNTENRKKDVRIRIKESPRDKYARSAVSKQLEKLTRKKTAKYKESIEDLCVQAGIPLTYIEFLSVRLLVCGVFILFFTIFFGNLFWGALTGLPVYFLFPSIFAILKNRRSEKIEAQLGSFMNMAISRYKVSGSMARVLEDIAFEFVGVEPIYSELLRTRELILRGVTDVEALNDFSRRSGNAYVKLFVDSYKNAAELGSQETTDKLLDQAYRQFIEHNESKLRLEKETHKSKTDVYMMLGVVVISVLIGSSINEGYFQFMAGTLAGRLCTLYIVGSFIGTLAVLIKKVDAPLE